MKTTELIWQKDQILGTNWALKNCMPFRFGPAPAFPFTGSGAGPTFGL